MADRYVFRCFSCQRDLAFAEAPGFRASCDSCHADVHVCKNCRFYDPKVYNECTEPSADVVREKERANFCEFFQPFDRDGKTGPSKDDLKALAEALFRKK